MDGFNVYHSLLIRQKSTTDHYPLRKYKWLNLWALAEKFLSPRRDKLVKVFYYTAFATWDPKKVTRHRTYLRALESVGVTPVVGNFKFKDKRCTLCNQTFSTPEEKETDVNIAIHLLEYAFQGMYDKALIVSGDSDLLPAVRAVKRVFPNIQLGVVVPPFRTAESLKNECHFSIKMKKIHLATSQLPNPVELANGISLPKPPSW